MKNAESKDSAAGAESKPADRRDDRSSAAEDTALTPTEIGGRDGPDPTRYGDWEKNGRCIDF